MQRILSNRWTFEGVCREKKKLNYKDQSVFLVCNTKQLTMRDPLWPRSTWPSKRVTDQAMVARVIIGALFVAAIGTALGLSIWAIVRAKENPVPTPRTFLGQDMIPGGTTIINLDTIDDWYPVIKTFLRKCRNFTLPYANDGDKLTIFNHHGSKSYFWHPNPFGEPRITGFNYAPGPAQFRWVSVTGPEQTIRLEWIEHNHGWTVMNQQEAKAAGVGILSLRPDAPEFFYLLSTAKGMYNDLPGPEDDHLPDRPTGVREGLIAIDMHPASVTYGQIKHKEYGSSALGEVHHGGIMHYPNGKRMFSAPSLDYTQSYLDVFSLEVPGFPRYVDTVTKAQLDALEVGALHTAHLDPQTGKLLVTYLYNSSTAGDVYKWSGGLIEVSSNFGSDGNEPTVGVFHRHGDDNLSVGQAATLDYTMELPLFCNEGAPGEDCAAVETILGVSVGSLPRSFATTDIDGTAYDFKTLGCQSARLYNDGAGIENGMTLATSAWSRADVFNNGFSPFTPYGRHVRIYDARRHTGFTNTTAPNAELVYTVELGSVYAGGPGIVPLELRQLHDPRAGVLYNAVTLPGAVLGVFQNPTTGTWSHNITVTPLQMMGHINDCASYDPSTETFAGCNMGKITNLVPNAPLNLPWLNATALGLVNAPVPLVTDITISQDDHFLYAAAWFAGCVLQYDIRDRNNVFLAGGICNLGGITDVFAGTLAAGNVYNPNSWTIAEDYEDSGYPLKWAGGPQMLRLFKGGQRLFATNSLFASWDEQYYEQYNATETRPNDGSFRNGGMGILINTGVWRGEKVAPMSVDSSFGLNGVLVHKEARMHEAHGENTMR